MVEARTLMIDHTTQRIGVSNMPDVNRTRRHLEHNDTASCKSFDEALLRARRQHVAKIVRHREMVDDPALHDDLRRGDVHLVRAPPPHPRGDNHEARANDEHRKKGVMRPSDADVVRRELHDHYCRNRHHRGNNHATSNRRHRDDVALTVTQGQSSSHAPRVRTRAGAQVTPPRHGSTRARPRGSSPLAPCDLHPLAGRDRRPRRPRWRVP